MKKKFGLMAILLAMICVVGLTPQFLPIGSAATYGDLTYTIVNDEVAITRCSQFATGSIHIPSELEGYPVTRIYGDAFINCTKVTHIYIPSTVAKIESGAFSWITNLQGIYVDEENQNYCADNGVLFNKDKTSLLQAPRTITKYVVPSSVTQIGNSAFNGCKNLSYVTIGENVTSIGSSAFSECTSLVSIAIPNTVKSIEGSAFYGCRNLSNVEFGNSVTIIGDYAFNYCDALTTISLPDSVTDINRAFNQCTNLTSIDIGNGVKSLDYRAFWGCRELSSITIGSGFTQVGKDAFEGCESLIDVYYYGTEEQWNRIIICDGNYYITERATVHYMIHDCQWDKGTVATTATCTEAGSILYTCTVCGTTKEETVEALGHTEVIDAGIAATCTEPGLSEGKHCSVCNTVMIAQTETPAKGHSHNSVVTTPTCTEKGYTTHTCACGDTYVDTYTDALGHDWDDGAVTKEPTEASFGERLFTCMLCGETKIETIPELNHTHSYTETIIKPTCTEQGHTTHICPCGDEYTDSYVNAAGHRYDSGDACTVCGQKDPNVMESAPTEPVPTDSVDTQPGTESTTTNSASKDIKNDGNNSIVLIAILFAVGGIGIGVGIALIVMTKLQK